MATRSIVAIAARESKKDKKVRDAIAAAQQASTKILTSDERKQRATASLGSPTVDSFVNFAQSLGVGADNPLSSSGYGFNPISRVRTTLEWIHRGSWLGGVAVDLVADDMTRAGVEIESTLKPEKIKKLDEAAVTLGIWNQIKEVIQWSRLYGGAIGVYMIDGQDWSTPLRLETVGKKQFRGIMVLDRWMVQPSLNNLVQEAGPDLGLPKFYTVIADAPALPRMKIHYSRCFRMVGINLPYWQRVVENLWGISVLERLYDRMIAFDSATTGVAQLVYKAYLRTYRVKGLREVIAAGGQAMQGLVQYVDMMRRFQGIEGITVMDADDEFEGIVHNAFSGLSDALLQLGQQLAGALQIPLVRLFGQSPAGLNATGESDLRMYYDMIAHRQNADLKVPVTKVYRMLAQSEGIALPEGTIVKFKSLWQLTDEAKAKVALDTTTAVVNANEAGIISDRVAAQELKQSSMRTGIFTNISAEDIEAADEVAAPAAEALMNNMTGEGEEGGSAEDKPGKPGEKESIKPAGKGGEKAGVAKTPKPKSKSKDHDGGVASVSAMKQKHDLNIVIENPRGSIRRGKGWETVLPADYGYVRHTEGADGDQVDCYVGDDVDGSETIYIVDQVDRFTGAFDEHKVLFGYLNEASAMFTYCAGFSDHSGSARVGAIHKLTIDQFKAWLADANLSLPYADWKKGRK